MADNFYDDLAADYDRVIRWDRRLEQERPMFEALCGRFGIRSVLDASCGTGHHLSLFAAMGMDVVGADVSPAMVARAEENTRKAGFPIPVVASSWAELPAKVSRTFDAVLSIGNSLPYVTEKKELHESLRGLWSRVNERGILLLQFKNFAKLRASGERFLPIASSAEPHETIALRMYDYHPDRIDFHVILLEKVEGEWRMRHHVTPLKPYTQKDILPLLHELAAEVSVYGSLGLEPFVSETSPDVVMVARHGERPAI